MSWYRIRVERDLARWQTAGWVNEAGAARHPHRSAIRAIAVRRRADLRHPRRRAVRLRRHELRRRPLDGHVQARAARACCSATLWGCYGAAALLFQRQLDAFAQAAVLGGIAVYGASIMLIAQMYHMEGNPPDAVLMWALGALAGRRAGAIAAGAGRNLRAAGRVDLLGARAQRRGALELSCRRGPLPPPRLPGSAGARACISPPSSLVRLARAARLLRARPSRALDRGR